MTNEDHFMSDKDTLVHLLHEAAKLEHCLLDTYLYAACSLKSMPQEFDTVEELSTKSKHKNKRRAIQHERVRAWKQSLLIAAREEMEHLHFVQCLLRALGEPPHFKLPKRDDSNVWFFPNWQPLIQNNGESHESDKNKNGVQVPIEPLTEQIIRQFVLYESSVSLQVQDLFNNSELKELFKELHEFELDIHFEGMLLHVEDANERNALKEKLRVIYTQLLPISTEEKLLLAVGSALGKPVEDIRFPSIGDLYLKGILPLYEQAFKFNWTKYSNVDLNNELLDENYAAEGFLPVGPFYRDKNFDQRAKSNRDQPLHNYKRLEDIVREIVTEGEGFANFETRAKDLLAEVKKNGSRAYLQKVIYDQENKKNPGYSTPAWLASGERLRKSHLYRFIMISEDFNQEIKLAKDAGVYFTPARQPLSVNENNLGLKQLTTEVSAQFNSCYLVLLTWLSRIYEIRDFAADKPRRQAIEMLASWPLMSMAIRPFLELISFFPIEPQDLFRLDIDALPLLPLHARQLHSIYEKYISKDENKDENNLTNFAKTFVKSIGNPVLEELADVEKINLYMDYFAVRVLADAAQWASEQIETVKFAKELLDNDKKMILARLQELSELSEFKKQFDFRVHGGYSNRLPDITYQQSYPDGNKFEENPGIPENPGIRGKLYENTFALRLRFSGWGLLQLATDPDPTYDEVGCTGTHMLHAADGDRRFDRALVWQNDLSQPNTILREPRTDLPDLGVNCVDVSLLVTDGSVKAGFTPLQVLNSQGAVQTSGVQQDLEIKGFLELLSLTPKDILNQDQKIRLNLLAKGDARPFLNGLNHLVWQDGEPIDPFILKVFADSGDSLFQREIFHKDEEKGEETTLLEMSPLQRALSSRGPVGFDNYSNIPDWAKQHLSQDVQKLMNTPKTYPDSYLKKRAEVLKTALSKQIQDDKYAVQEDINKLDIDQSDIDAAVSLAERLYLVSIPRNTTRAWLNFLLHYGHTVSGEISSFQGNNPILSKFEEKTKLLLSLDTNIDDRGKPNARWLAKYTKGIMDTDALSNFVFFELYIPVSVQTTAEPINLAKEWTFPATMKQAVAEYACKFEKPFWESYNIEGEKRTRTLSNFPDTPVITENRQKQGDHSYEYAMIGVNGISDFIGKFDLSDSENDQVTLKWAVSFKSNNPQLSVLTASLIGKDAQEMTTQLVSHFSPRT